MIQISTFEFLNKLKKNNSKEWFDKNRTLYETAKTDFQKFIDELIVSISNFDTSIKHLKAKECMFRINRDVRFSNNKSPYKTNMGASISPGGKKSFSAGYYLHIEPSNSFLAGGMWQPPSPQINAIRQEIDYNVDEFKKIISDKIFKKHFKTLSQEDKLKTAPKGYEKTHPDLDLLKYKSYIVVEEFTDEEVLSKNFLKQCTSGFQAMYPLNKFLRMACD